MSENPTSATARLPNRIARYVDAMTPTTVIDLAGDVEQTEPDRRDVRAIGIENQPEHVHHVVAAVGLRGRRLRQADALEELERAAPGRRSS